MIINDLDGIGMVCIVCNVSVSEKSIFLSNNTDNDNSKYKKYSKGDNDCVYKELEVCHFNIHYFNMS